MRYFCGESRGYSPGDVIIPAIRARAIQSLEDAMALGGSLVGSENLGELGRIVMASSKKVARCIAEMSPGGGALYQVKPLGDVEDDTAKSGMTFTARSVCVLAVYDAHVAHNPKALARFSAYAQERAKLLAPQRKEPLTEEEARESFAAHQWRG